MHYCATLYRRTVHLAYHHGDPDLSRRRSSRGKETMAVDSNDWKACGMGQVIAFTYYLILPAPGPLVIARYMNTNDDPPCLAMHVVYPGGLLLW